MAVLLTHAMDSRLPGTGGGGLGGVQSIPPDARARVLPLLSDAFASTFTWALVLICLAIVPALLLPRHKPVPLDDDDETDADAAPLLVHA
jgi:hypothetical protein